MKKEISKSKILSNLFFREIDKLELLILEIILINFNIDNNSRILNIINNRFIIDSLISLTSYYFLISLII